LSLPIKTPTAIFSPSNEKRKKNRPEPARQP
jgi:hypothetical protein